MSRNPHTNCFVPPRAASLSCNERRACFAGAREAQARCAHSIRLGGCDGYDHSPPGSPLKQSDGTLSIHRQQSRDAADFMRRARRRYHEQARKTERQGTRHGGSAGGVEPRLQHRLGRRARDATHYTGVTSPRPVHGQATPTAAPGPDSCGHSKPQTLNCCDEHTRRPSRSPRRRQCSNPPVADADRATSVNVTRRPGQPSYINLHRCRTPRPMDRKCTYDAKKTKGLLGPDDTRRGTSA